MKSVFILTTREQSFDIIIGVYTSKELALKSFKIFTNLAKINSEIKITEVIQNGLTSDILSTIKPYKSENGDNLIKVNNEIYENFLYEYLPTLNLTSIIETKTIDQNDIL